MNQKNVEWTTDHGTTYLDIHITPISDPSGSLIGVNLTFIDVSPYVKLEDELEHANSKLARVTQELQLSQNVIFTTKSHLKHTQEEL